MDLPPTAWAILGVIALASLAVVLWCQHSTEVATKRAEALVREHLTPTELTQLDNSGALQVASCLTPGRVYSVPVRGAVTVLHEGRPVMRLCIRPSDELPGREAVLAHKLHIEAAEEDYLRKANVVWRSSADGPWFRGLPDATAGQQWYAARWEA